MKQYFVKPKMKFSFQWESSTIVKFRFSICSKERLIDFPILPKTLSLFKCSVSIGLVVQFCYREGAVLLKGRTR